MISVVGVVGRSESRHKCHHAINVPPRTIQTAFPQIELTAAGTRLLQWPPSRALSVKLRQLVLAQTILAFLFSLLPSPWMVNAATHDSALAAAAVAVAAGGVGIIKVLALVLVLVTSTSAAATGASVGDLVTDIPPQCLHSDSLEPVQGDLRPGACNV